MDSVDASHKMVQRVNYRVELKKKPAPKPVSFLHVFLSPGYFIRIVDLSGHLVKDSIALFSDNHSVSMT